jgi:hypothetical protein
MVSRMLKVLAFVLDKRLNVEHRGCIKGDTVASLNPWPNALCWWFWRQRRLARTQRHQDAR